MLHCNIPWHCSDFNDDDAICSKDLNKVMDMLTGGRISQTVKDKVVEHVRLSRKDYNVIFIAEGLH